MFISARFFDETTNQNFEEVTIDLFQKNGTEIPVVTQGGHGFFYDPDGGL